ncbi:MAG: multiheme c-type cytochrome [Opitutae bacterium]
MADTQPTVQVTGAGFFPSWRTGRCGLLAIGWGWVMATGTLRSAEHQPSPENRPVQALAAGYVSSDTCRSCHPGNYASWHASFHRTMTQIATPENIAASLDGLELTYDGWDYRVDRGGRGYAVRRKPQGAPTTAYGAPQAVVLLTGSHTLQILWLETGAGRTLVQFPFAYIVAEKKWAPVQQTFLLPPEAGQFYAAGEWNGACMDCHVTQGRSRFVADNTFDSQVSEFGIACEACHGEGREHIAKNRNPVRRFALHLGGGADSTIVNPARLTGPQSSLVCGQCHSIWAFNNMADKIAWNQHGGKFPPDGKQLDRRWVVQPGGQDHPQQRAMLQQTNPHFFGDRFWGDGMVRVTGRELNGTMASPCNSGGKFSCLSCHEMHPAAAGEPAGATWKNDQLKPGGESDQACLQCHEGLRAKLTAHTHHAAESSGSRCYNCHMPHTTYGLLRAIRSHQVSSPTVRESTEHGRPNACNLCHLDQPLAWTAGKLAEWYGQKAPELAADDREWAAGAQWLLKGDAAQRALVVWSMGWGPAQRAAGRNWLYPYLIFTLNDPYAAVRFMAWKSLQTLPGFTGYAFDYTGDDAAQKTALAGAYQKWWQELRPRGEAFRAPTILEPAGRFRTEVFERLLNQRDNRKVFLAE